MQPIARRPDAAPPAAPPHRGTEHRPAFDPLGGLFLAREPRMLELRALAERVAATPVPVLILGESGVGKGELARFLHEASPRAGRPFVQLNCSAMPPELLHSELFGHERTALPGIPTREEGKFELARGGTLLLDEIGATSPALQAKLLQTLEEGSHARHDGGPPVRVDARVISTSTLPLEPAIEEGEFRKDLYFRLKGVCFRIPSLRERPADIPLLADRFARDYARLHGQTSAAIPERLMEAFLAHPWPGNVRELRHLVQRYLILPDVELVLAELDEASGVSTPAVASDAAADGADDSGRISLKAIAARAADDAEKRVILRVLESTRWNRRRAAAKLDICYKTLLNKLHQWNLYDDEAGEAGRSGPPYTGQPYAGSTGQPHAGPAGPGVHPAARGATESPPRAGGYLSVP